MSRASVRLRVFRWVGGVLCAVALLVAAVPVVGHARVALSDDEVRLDGGAQQVSLPPGKTWGVYVNDADNSGYSEQCSAVEASGRQVTMRDPGFTISGSDTETLNWVFDTGSGQLTFSCSAPGEQVTIRPVANLKSLVIGIIGGGILGLIGLGLVLNWGFARSSPRPVEPWVGWGTEPRPPESWAGWGTAPVPVKRPKGQVAGIALLVVVVIVGLLTALVVAWNSAIKRIGDGVLGDYPNAGEYFEIPGTDDPALIALGDELLADVATPPGATRDPYGSACWVIGVSLCMTSDDLDTGKLLDATAAQLRDRGAKLEKRWCFIDQCYAYLKYQGAPLMLLVDHPERPLPKPAIITGSVVTNDDPDTPSPPGAPLGSWASLSATPTTWKAPSCVQREAGGCRQYDGTFAGPASTADAVADLRRMLKSSGYAVVDDNCPARGPVEYSCSMDVRRFRTLGSRDGVMLLFRITPGDAKGFEVTMKGQAYPN